MTPEVEIVPELDQPFGGVAGQKWQGCELRDLDGHDLRFAKRFARHGGIRHAITGILEDRYWSTHRRLAHEGENRWRGGAR